MMGADDEIEVWFCWNDGRRESPISELAPRWYVGTKDGTKIRWFDVTASPHLEEMKAMADLLGECKQSLAFRMIPWSENFEIPAEWLTGLRGVYL